MKEIVSVLFVIVFLSSLIFVKRQKNKLKKFVPEDNSTLLFAGQNNKDFEEFVEINKKFLLAL